MRKYHGDSTIMFFSILCTLVPVERHKSVLTFELVIYHLEYSSL